MKYLIFFALLLIQTICSAQQSFGLRLDVSPVFKPNRAFVDRVESLRGCHIGLSCVINTERDNGVGLAGGIGLEAGGMSTPQNFRRDNPSATYTGAHASIGIFIGNESFAFKPYLKGLFGYTFWKKSRMHHDPFYGWGTIQIPPRKYQDLNAVVALGVEFWIGSCFTLGAELHLSPSQINLRTPYALQLNFGCIILGSDY